MRERRMREIRTSGVMREGIRVARDPAPLLYRPCVLLCFLEPPR